MQTQLARNPKALAYVAVEAVSKKWLEDNLIKGASDIDSGLFAGIEVDPDGKTTYLVINKGPADDLVLDLAEYNILSITLSDGADTEYLFLRNTEEDQQTALTELAEILTGLTDEKRTIEGHNLVDLTTYTSIPDNIGVALAGGKSVAETYSSHTAGQASRTVQNAFEPQKKARVVGQIYSQPGGAGCGSGAASCGTGVNRANNQTCNGDKIPTYYKRKSAPPTKKVLKALAAKLVEIQDGTYSPEYPDMNDSAEIYVASSTGSTRNDRAFYGWEN